MYRVHQIILFGFLALFLNFSGNESARAAALEIVFKDSLWGAAIGGVGGLAAWALQDTDKENKLLRKYVSPWAATGLFLGMGYGFYDASQGGDVFMSKSPSKGLLHFQSKEKLIIVKPSGLLPQWNFTRNHGRFRLKLLTVSF